MATDVKKKIGPLPGAARRAAVAGEELVGIAPLAVGKDLPLLARPAVEGVSLAGWAQRHRQELAGLLLRHGGILFRGFALAGADDLDHLVRAMAGEPVEYTYRSTPRTRVSGGVYTSTEYPADQAIPMHNEMSYARDWPMRIWFLCQIPAEAGGETPIADSRAVYRHIDPEVRERFAGKGVLYVRNYGEALDLPWPSVFQTAERGQVEEYCRKAGIEVEWIGRDGLRTRQVCQGVAVHPVTGDPVWFNQAHLFHVSSLPQAIAESLLGELGDEGVPRNCFYGDGSAIEPESLEAVRRAYAAEAVSFPWQAGDVLMLDNMLAAHGRAPFRGPRKVLVAMAELCSAAIGEGTAR